MKRHSCLLAILLVTSPAWAWNGTGHMTMAAIAYRHLGPQLRTRVDALLAHHPNVVEWDADREKQPSALEPGEYRFLRASTWPDEIERKPGWPNHTSWHYANFPISGLQSRVQPDPDARRDLVTGLLINEATVADRHATDEERAIALAYVIHLVGDIHQPLHCATAITPSHPAPNGDRGGNGTMISIDGKTPVKLHAFWDGLFGEDKNASDADRRASLLERESGTQAGDTAGSEKDWCLDSWRIAQLMAYPRATWTTGDEPIPVGSRYVKQAKRVGQQQLVIGGVRLAAVLARVLKQ